MLSIIICSVNEKLLHNLKKNISATIGVEYEFLIYNNEQNKGLCEVYNFMAAKAQFPYLCFLHEDLIFQTNDWGKILIEIFGINHDLGLVGVAGGKYKGKALSGWFSGIKHMDYYHISHSDAAKTQMLSNSANWVTSENQVVSIDGVFMAVKKFIWREIRFNETLLNGFHFYDIDFSLRIAKLYKVFVTNKINIVHITKGGDFGDSWIKEAFLFHERMKESLPITFEKVNHNFSEIIVAKTWLDRLKIENITLKNKIKWIKAQHLHKQKKLWFSILKFLLYRPMQIKLLHDLIKKIKGKHSPK